MLMEEGFYKNPNEWLIKNLTNYKNHYEELINVHGEIASFRKKIDELEKMIDKLQGKEVEDAEKYDELIEQIMVSLIAQREKEQMTYEKAEEVSEIAADWWKQKVDNPSHDAKLDEKSQLLTLLLAENMPETEYGKTNAFKNILKEMIKKELIERRYIDLYVDYGPRGVLCDAAKESNLLSQNHDEFDMTHIFPWKTSMKISLDQITVKEGYGSEQETIFERDSKKIK